MGGRATYRYTQHGGIVNIPTPLIHYSDTPLVDPQSKDPGKEGRPLGLWVSVGDAWLVDQYKRCLEQPETPEQLGGSHHYPRQFKYANEITIVDTSNILVITNENDFKAFNDRYSEPWPGLDPTLDPPARRIRWRDVRELYQGIIISPYLKNMAGSKIIPESAWYHTWIVASGCLWDVSVIADIRTERVTRPPF